jgi:hypothetical protein
VRNGHAWVIGRDITMESLSARRTEAGAKSFLGGHAGRGPQFTVWSRCVALGIPDLEPVLRSDMVLMMHVKDSRGCMHNHTFADLAIAFMHRYPAACDHWC